MPDPAGGGRKTTYAISDLAGEFDVSTRTIRFYEEKGLISPARTPGGQRVYTRRDRARLKLILRGKRLGYSLEEISDMIGMASVNLDEESQIRKSLGYGEKKLREIAEREEELRLLGDDLRSLKARLLERLAQLNKD